ncbi:MAG: hypothetical protein U0736_13285 [Gemmataceae bacterium]
MWRRNLFALLLASLVGMTSALAGGVTGRGGFEALAVSADGKTVAVGGQNRVVYLVNAATGQVTRRIYLGARVANLAFNGDGTRLVVEDETSTLHLIELASGKTLQKREQVSGLTLLSGDRVLVRDEKVLAGNRLLILSLDRLAQERILAVEDPPAAWTVDPAGKRLTVLGRGTPTADERRVPLTDTPANLKGLDRVAFRLKNDGLRAAAPADRPGDRQDRANASNVVLVRLRLDRAGARRRRHLRPQPGQRLRPHHHGRRGYPVPDPAARQRRARRVVRR